MKKLIYLASILLAGVMITMYSCTKRNESSAPQKANQSGLSAEDIRMNALIQGFQKDLAYYYKNPDIKDGASKSVDSALWILESTLNYSHAFPSELYTDFEIDTLSLSVNKNADGEVLMTELAQKYQELKNIVSVNYNDSEFEEKALDGIVMTKQNENSDAANFSVMVFTGEKGIDPGPPNPIVDGPFEEGDNWWYGEDGGQCDAPGMKDSDAAQELKIEMEAYIAEQNQGAFFLGPFQIVEDLKGGDEEIQIDDTPDNYLDYYLYYASTEIGPCTDDVLCVEWTEMNYYYQKLKSLLYSFLPENRPELQDLDIQTLIIFDDNAIMNATEDIERFHYLRAKYGHKYSGAPTPTELTQ